MQNKILINLLLSLVGILAFYLIRSKEIIWDRIEKGQVEEVTWLEIAILRVSFEIININMKIFINNKIISSIIGKDNKILIADSLSRKLSLLKRYTESLKKNLKEPSMENVALKTNDSISDMLIRDKSKRNEKVMIVTFVYAIVSYCLYIFNNTNIQYIVFIFLTAIIWIISINQILLTYRNKKGYYGTNYDEAKEIIYFIKKISGDDNNRFRGKRNLNEVVEQEQVSVTNDQKVTA